jgi:hypothetical protein
MVAAKVISVFAPQATLSPSSRSRAKKTAIISFH